MTKRSSDISDKNVSRPPPHLIEEYEKASQLTLTDSLHLGARLEFLRRTGSSRIEVKESTVRELLEEVVQVLNHRKINSRVPALIKRHISNLGKESDEHLSEEQLRDLETQTSSWIHLLARELNDERRIPATDTGILDVSKLSESPEDLFQESVWDWLDERPCADIQEACKTITVGCATSSVMLSLRAVEHCLRKWYEQQNESMEAAWGRVLDQLMEEYAEEEKKNDTVLTQLSDLPPVLTTLYYLKEKRNEVNHPEKSPSLREARRTLMIVASTITEIHREMRSEAAWEIGDEITHQERLRFEDSSISSSEESLKRVIEKRELTENGAVEKSYLYEMAPEWGLDEEEMDEILQNLLMNGHLYEPAQGKLKAI
ncbi:hypothetical protein [Halobellus rarus]|uniref:Uncharacterized protein n=1 Tax=Halobellus rarus TaxID=1126237 RepID=A0ABD6CTA7_9EURY|nr:hypothetical protein [Halobellus rarus]